MGARLLLRRCPGLLTSSLGTSAAACWRRGFALGGVRPPPLPADGGRPSGPATAATGSREGLGRLGGAKADYDEKFPQGERVHRGRGGSALHRDMALRGL